MTFGLPKLILPLLLVLFASKGFGQSSKEIEGRWYTIDNEAIVEISGDNHIYSGKIIWINPSKPDQIERRKLLNEEVISHLKYLERNEYEDGDLFDVRGDRHFKISAELENDELTLIVHWGWFTKDITWYRVPEALNIR